MNQTELVNEITRADANASQAKADGRIDAALQWQRYALECSKAKAEFESNRLREVIANSAKAKAKAKAKAPRGYILFEGPSLLDGGPIVVIAIVKSSNRKTGDMVQTYILRADLSPLDAVKVGNDSSICGNCPHRGIEGKGRSCYVNLGQGPLAVFKAYKAGNYPKVSPINPTFQASVKGRKVRLGTYGDPAAVSRLFWNAVLQGADGWTGYTHQWRTRPDLQNLCMASCDTLQDYESATKAGWRTFRVRLESLPLMEREIACPASEEAGKRTTCDSCGLCKGTAAAARNIAIVAHGGIVVAAAARRMLSAVN